MQLGPILMISGIFQKLVTPYYLFRYGLHPGWCPICERKTVFYKRGAWLRDDLRCIMCNSIPRWRAIIFVMNTYFPDWRTLSIHESSPGGASSIKIKKECNNYTPTHYFPDCKPGSFNKGFRCENLEDQSFPDETFDLVITQDVLEHVFDPAKALIEIRRTLRPKGAHIFTIPWYKGKSTVVRAVKEAGKIQHLLPPDYHGNPIDKAGTLVVSEWGDDFVDFIKDNSGMTTSIIDAYDAYMGIEGAFREIFISRK